MFNPDWWRCYDKPEEIPPLDRVMLSVDCTFTDSDTSDYVVGSVIGQAGSSYYLLDMSRERTDIMGTVSMMIRMKERTYFNYSVDGIIIELAANGHAAYQLLSKRIPGLIGYKPGDRSKIARLAGIVPVVEAGNVWLPKNAPWLDTFINEFSLFPAAKNDDICDSVAQCINYMGQRTVPALTELYWGRGAFLPQDLTMNAVV
jgi:predicted phage terminase large subunit-like protein